MTVKKFCQKSVVVEAMQFVGGRESADAIREFAGRAFGCWWVDDDHVTLCTQRGIEIVNKGDWAVKDARDGFHACKPDVFEAVYEEVTE